MWESIRKRAEEGDAAAQYNLAQLYYNGGPDVRQNYNAAFKWYSRASEQGDLQVSLPCVLVATEAVLVRRLLARPREHAYQLHRTRVSGACLRYLAPMLTGFCTLSIYCGVIHWLVRP